MKRQCRYTRTCGHCMRVLDLSSIVLRDSHCTVGAVYIVVHCTCVCYMYACQPLSRVSAAAMYVELCVEFQWCGTVS